MTRNKPARWAHGLATLALACCASVLGASSAQAAATITIVNANEPGIGFNDPTPAARSAATSAPRWALSGSSRSNTRPTSGAQN